MYVYNTIIIMASYRHNYILYIHYTIKFILLSQMHIQSLLTTLMFLVIQILHYGISDSAWCTPTSTCWSGRWGRLLMSITLL